MGPASPPTFLLWEHKTHVQTVRIDSDPLTPPKSLQMKSIGFQTKREKSQCEETPPFPAAYHFFKNMTIKFAVFLETKE